MIADGRLLDIIRRLHTFGLTLLKMDLRQESTRHSEVIAAICDALGVGDFAAWSEEEKCKWLARITLLLALEGVF
jgi:phosphoenolpyruvate carboxylase